VSVESPCRTLASDSSEPLFQVRSSLVAPEQRISVQPGTTPKPGTNWDSAPIRIAFSGREKPLGGASELTCLESGSPNATLFITENRESAREFDEGGA